MSALKTYKGSMLNLENYKGESVIDYYFDILEDDDSASDLTVYESITLSIFAKRGGTLIDLFDNNSGLTIAGNRVTWNASKARMDQFQRLVYYPHIVGKRKTGGQEDVLFYGNSVMI